MSRPRLVFLVTEDWYFLSHRLPMARAAMAAGYEVHVITRLDRGEARIRAEGIVAHHVDLKRGSTLPHHLAASVAQVRRLYQSLKPDIVHHVSLQSVIIGSLASAGMKFGIVNALTGLGATFARGRGLAAQLIRLSLPAALNRAGAMALVQNEDDAATLRRLNVRAAHIVRIAGSGVDVDKLTALPAPEGPPTIAFVGRMLDYKGVRDVVEAHRLLRAQGRAPALLLAGAPDPMNAHSILEEELRGWAGEPGIEWLGHVSDVAQVWARAHVAVLPSHAGEGVPLSALEAAACGRAIITTDTPGCRDVVRRNDNGLLVPPRDPAALADAIAALIAYPARRAEMGVASRARAEQEFSAEKIGREIVALYQRVRASP